MTPRKYAVTIIENWLTDDKNFPDRQISEVQNGRPFVTEVVYGICRHYSTLAWVIEQLAREYPKPDAEALLLLGLYELYYMDTEPYAAINEAVNMASSKNQKGFINGLLRSADRKQDDIFLKLNKAPFHIQASFPKVLTDRWTERFGKADTKTLCGFFNQPAETIVRINPTAVSEDIFVKNCKEKSISVSKKAVRTTGTFYTIPRGVPVPSLPGFNDGWFSVQDPATATAIDLLEPKPGEKILDACAAPGGKTVAIASLMQDDGELVAMDIHDDRIAQLKQTLLRMDFPRVEVRQGDAREQPPVEERDEFDAILLDVPCMNTGVLGRRADARWRFSLERMEKMRKTQLEILNACALRLKPGGRIVYSTCSLEPEENELLVEEWAKSTLDFELRRTKKVWPFKKQTDGAFAALLVRDSYEG